MRTATLLDWRGTLGSDIRHELLTALHVLDRVTPVVAQREFPASVDPDLRASPQKRQPCHVSNCQDVISLLAN